MCLLAIFYRSVPGAPLLVAANREEFFDRPFQPPLVQRRERRFLAGLDLRAGGTWLGVNERGLVAAVTNRPKAILPERPRSRGLLCRDLLGCATAQVAAEYLRQELASGVYAGASILIADPEQGTIVDLGDELRFTPLTPGLHLLTNGPPDDVHDPRQTLAREMFAAELPHDVSSFLAIARRVCSQGPDAHGRSIVLRRAGRGTVSSTLLAITARPDDATYEFAGGAPDVTPYTDYSDELRELLSGGLYGPT
jgi:uncharacterized protein with NRDE domain